MRDVNIANGVRFWARWSPEQTAIRFDGPAVRDLLHTENAVLALSGELPLTTDLVIAETATDTTVQIVTERKIKDALLDTLAASQPGDQVDIMVFYLSDRDVIEALIGSHKRDVTLRVLLDPNKDAFGRQKNGIPTRPVAWELNSCEVPVRWCDTHGEQSHVKMLLHRSGGGEARLITGSANFSRRDLADLNLETDVVVAGSGECPVFREAQRFFDDAWDNTSERAYSVPYSAYADRSIFRRWLYRFMEASGFSAF